MNVKYRQAQINKVLRAALPLSCLAGVALALVSLGGVQQAQASPTPPPHPTSVGSIGFHWGSVSGQSGNTQYTLNGTGQSAGTTGTASGASFAPPNTSDPGPFSLSSVNVNLTPWEQNGNPVTVSSATITESSGKSVTVNFNNMDMVQTGTVETITGTITTSNNTITDYSFGAMNGGPVTLTINGVVAAGGSTDGFVAFISPTASGNGVAFAAVPEPTSFVLFGLSGVALGIYRWRRRGVKSAA